MALVPATSVTYIGDGSSTLYAVPFEYLKQSHIKVTVEGVSTSFTLSNPSTISIVPAPQYDAEIVVSRDTPALKVPYIFADGVPFLTRFTDINWKSLLFVLQEAWHQMNSIGYDLVKVLRAPEAIAMLPNSAARASRVLGFDANGQPVALHPIDSGMLELITPVETFAALATTPATTAGMVVYTKQHTGSGLGGGYFQDVFGTVTNNGGTLINNSATPGRHWRAINYLNTTPQMFGAYANGVADDTIACQLAINSGAACLHWPQGVYNISAAGLTGVTGQRWVGAGIGLTTIKAAVAPNSDFIFFAAKNTVDISGITFDGNGLLTSTVAGHFPGIQPCIHFSQCNAVKVDRCQFIGFYTSGCFGNACHDVDITNSIVTRSTAVGELINYGIHFSGSVGNESYNIRIDKCTATRVNIALNAFNSTVSNCIVSGWAFSSGVNIVASSTCYRNKIVNCTIYNSVQLPDRDNFYPCGIENWSHDTAMSNNTIYGCYGDGIENGGKNCTITGNNCFINNGSGIYNLYYDGLYNASGTTVVSNSCNDNQQYGIKEQSPLLEAITMSGNNVSGNIVGRYDVKGATAYEDEGTCTLTIVGGTTPGVQEYTLNTFAWSRRGRQVTLEGRISLASGTGVGQLRISNLPFTARNSAGLFGTFPVGFSGAVTGLTSLVGIIQQGQTYLTLSGLSSAASGGFSLSFTDINTSTFTLTFSCTYLV